MKKQFMRYLCFLLIFSMICPLVSFAQSSSVEMYFSDSFEDYAEGLSKPSGYNMVDKGNVCGVREKDGNRYFNMRVNTSADMHLDHDLPKNIEGQFVFEMDLMLEDYGNVTKYVQLMDSAGADVFLIKLTPGGTIQTFDGVEVAGYVTEKFFTVSLAIDTESDLMDVYVNSKKRIRNHPINIENAKRFRIHMKEVGGESSMNLDNLKFYSGYTLLDSGKKEGETDVKVTSNLVQDTMKNAVAMYLNKSNVLVNGEKAYTSPEKNIVPYKKDDAIMLPVRFFATSIGGNVEWNSQDSSATVSCGEKSLTVISSKDAEFGGGGALYASAELLCNAFDKYLHTEDNGIIIYSDNDLSGVLDWQNNLKLMRNISESYMFDDASGDELFNMISQKHPDKSHPRLIVTEDLISRIKGGISSGDPVYVRMFDLVQKDAERFMNEKTSAYDISDGIRLLEVCRENSKRMLTTAFMYLITDDERYAQRAYLEMYTSACFKDWNPYHFLDVGEMTASMGICYDWLYNWMDEGQRKIIRESIVEKGIKPIIEDFDDKPRSRSWNWRGELADNWCIVISGVGVASMAIVDELSGQDLEDAKRAMEQTLLDIRRALSLFAPYGAYEEGFMYWEYAMKYFTIRMLSLETAIGSDLGYVDVPGMRMTNDFMTAINGSVSAFTYHDTAVTQTDFPTYMMFLADYFGEYGQAAARVNQIMSSADSPDSHLFDIILYNPKMSEAIASQNELDTYLPVTEVATMRSGWDKTDMYVGFHCDDPIGGEGHDHMDTGTFVLDAMGETFFFDLGADDYNLPGYINAYRIRAEGHNTVIFNPDMEYDQKYGGKAKIVKHEFKPRGGYAIGDMTKAYNDDDEVKSFKRGVKLDSNRTRAVVQDEIRLGKPGDIWWFAHTKAKIEVSDDKKSAVLEKNGKKLLATIISGDGAEFSVMDAIPLETSPKVPGQNPNSGIRKLVIQAKNCDSLDLCVSFVPYDYTYNEALYDNSFVPLDQWTIEDGEYIGPKYAQATDITIDGVSIPGFSPDCYEYTIDVDDISKSGQIVAAKGNGKVEVVQKDGLVGTAYVYVKSDDINLLTSRYEIHFTIVPTMDHPKDKTIIKPVSVRASSVPEEQHAPEHTIDGIYTTRWACSGSCWIEYDLGEVKSLNSVGVSFMEGNTRTAQFTIELSTDGKNYTTYFEGDALSTLELDNHKLFGAKARYIRINGRGYNNNRDEYTSISEFVCYGE